MPTPPPFFMLMAATLVAFLASMPGHASDQISALVGGRSALVTQPHVTAELIPESILVEEGQPLSVVLHLHMDKDWHTYWINPGDAGLATTIKWTLPPGWSAGPIQWPTPEIHAMGPLTTYGYGGDVYLLTTLTPGPVPDGKVVQTPIKAHASWLVCQEECIPGRGDFDLTLSSAAKDAPLGFVGPDNTKFFDAARARLPVANTRWTVMASYTPNLSLGGASDQNGIWLTLQDKAGAQPGSIGKVRFFPEQPNVLSTKDSDNGDSFAKNLDIAIPVALIQNGEKPDHLSGVLVSDQPLVGQAKAVYLPSFPVTGGAVAPTASSLDKPAAAPQAVAAAGPAGASSTASVPGAAVPATQPFLLAVLGAAFLGGLILNLMPCVLPVLSLKVFSLIKHAGENSGTAWRQGLAFTGGVIVSFWILAGLLLILRAAGNHLGWGFQMQSPGFVLALTFLFFLLGLNLFGVFELGTSLVGLDAKASSHLGGLTSSFANGALATLAATPCTAPFMGSSVGFAAQQPAAISLLIFTFLALGMAAPYLVLTTFPGALRLVPRPGPWMEALRQLMGFLLMGTVIFLVYVFGALVGQDQVPSLLGALLLAGFAAWLYGRWSSPIRPAAVRTVSFLVALVVLGLALVWGAELTQVSPAPGVAKQSDGWQIYSPDAVKQALAQQRPVFVDFTAAWCLSCKVNERVALDIDSTKHAFAEKNVALFRGDWTHSDPEISKALRDYNRDGVPLYLLYSPKNPDAPQVLPEVLTPGIVQQALQNM